jgi:hypothetical protein
VAEPVYGLIRRVLEASDRRLQAETMGVPTQRPETPMDAPTQETLIHVQGQVVPIRTAERWPD